MTTVKYQSSKFYAQKGDGTLVPFDREEDQDLIYAKIFPIEDENAKVSQWQPTEGSTYTLEGIEVEFIEECSRGCHNRDWACLNKGEIDDCSFYISVARIKEHVSNTESHLMDAVRYAAYGLVNKKQSDRDFLRWIYNRMRYVHSENPNYDYMVKLKELSSVKDYKPKDEQSEVEKSNPAELDIDDYIEYKDGRIGRIVSIRGFIEGCKEYDISWLDSKVHSKRIKQNLTSRSYNAIRRQINDLRCDTSYLNDLKKTRKINNLIRELESKSINNFERRNPDPFDKFGELEAALARIKELESKLQFAESCIDSLGDKLSKLQPSEEDSLFKKLVAYSFRYHINVQLWPDMKTIYVEKNDVDLYSYGSYDLKDTMQNIVDYLDRITRKPK